MLLLTWNLAKFHRGTKEGREVAAVATAEEQEAEVRRNSKESMFVNHAGRLMPGNGSAKSNLFLEDICRHNNLDTFLLNNNCTFSQSKQKQ